MHDLPLSNLLLIPRVIHIEYGEQFIIIDLIINKNLRCFKGHFDDAPVVAGVVQLDWAILFAQKYLVLQGKTHKISALKFQKLMQPQMEIQLVLTKLSENKFSFKYSANDIVFSSAKVEMC